MACENDKSYTKFHKVNSLIFFTQTKNSMNIVKKEQFKTKHIIEIGESLITISTESDKIGMMILEEENFYENEIRPYIRWEVC
jgi:hypothetical protein